MANNLKMYRGKLGLSQQALANKLNLTRVAINYVENGSSSFTKTKTLEACKIFDCTPIELLGEDNFKFQPDNDSDRDKLIKIILKKYDNQERKDIILSILDGAIIANYEGEVQYNELEKEIKGN